MRTASEAQHAAAYFLEDPECVSRRPGTITIATITITIITILLLLLITITLLVWKALNVFRVAQVCKRYRMCPGCVVCLHVMVLAEVPSAAQ